MNTLTQVTKSTTIISCNREKHIDVVTSMSDNSFKCSISFTKETTDAESLGDKRSFMISLLEAQGIDLSLIKENKPRIGEKLKIGRIFISPKQSNMFGRPIVMKEVSENLNSFTVGRNNVPRDNILSVDFKPLAIYEESLKSKEPGGSRYSRMVLEDFSIDSLSPVKTIEGGEIERRGSCFRKLYIDLDLTIFIDLLTGYMQVITKSMPGYSIPHNESKELSEEQKETFRELDFEVVGIEIHGSLDCPK
jgi:hypothetical protein